MDTAIILCDNDAEVAAAEAYLRTAGAVLRNTTNCEDLSIHTVEGTPDAPTFSSEYHKMGNFKVVIGDWT